MPKIAVDIDDTLYSFSAVSRDALFHMALEQGDKSLLRAAYAAPTQWRIPNDAIGADAWLEAIRIAHRPEVIATQKPFPGAKETMWGLADEGHEIIYISNRDEEAAEATRQWLIDQGFPMEPYAELKCLWGDKIPHLRDCQYIIDDRPSTLIRFVYDSNWTNGHFDQQRRGFAILASYNENLTDIPNLYLAPSWAGMNYYLVRKDLMSEAAYRPYDALKEAVK